MPEPLELVYSVIPFRAVFSRSFREVVALSGAVVAVTIGASFLSSGSAGVVAVAGEANSIVGTLGFAGILFLAIRAMAAAERSAARERVVSRAVLAFGSVRCRDELIAVVSEAATALFVDAAPGQVTARVSVADEPEQRGELVSTTTSLLLDGSTDERLRLVVEGGSPTSHQENGDSLSLLAHGASLAFGQLSLQRVLEAKATQDPLTGAANRRSFIEQTAQAQSEAEAGMVSLWLLFIDVDDFKAVNDAHGHHVGDAVLVAFVDRMRARVSDGGVVARVGGDEFALLLIGEPGDEELGELVAARVRTELQRPVDTPEGGAVVASASVGVVRWRQGMDITDLMRAADGAMYQHKRSRQDESVPTTVDSPGL